MTSYNLEDGEEIELSASPIGEGGEGRVFNVVTPVRLSNLVAKVLFEEKRTNERRFKVRYMVDNPPTTADQDGNEFLIWPRYMMLKGSDFVGFLMPKAEGRELKEVMERWNSDLIYELGSEWSKLRIGTEDSQISRLVICSNIAKAVHNLHLTNQYVIGDLKPENIYIKSNGFVSILDLDSCQITVGGEVRYESRMNTPKYNPPESGIRRKVPTWDYFIMAVIFYEILCGIHPFTGTTKEPYAGFNTPDQKIREGLFPFGSKKDFFEVIAVPHYNFKRLPLPIQTLFGKCFDTGIWRSNERPSTVAWISILTAKPLIKEFVANRTTIIAGFEITINWIVDFADDIEINEGIGKVNGVGSLKLKPMKEKCFKMIAKNRFGSDERTLSIITFPTPVLESLSVSSPTLSNTVSFVELRVESPKIDVSVNLHSKWKTGLPFTLPSTDLQSIKPTYRLTNFFPNLTESYERIRKSIFGR